MEKSSIEHAEVTLKNVTHDAFVETQAQKHATILSELRTYPKAVFFSMLMSLCIIMEGYDTALVGNFYSLAQFNKKYGQPVNDGTGQYQLTSSWQSGIQNGQAGGQLVGLIAAGYIADRIGYVKTIIGAQVIMIGAIFIPFYAQNVATLVGGYVLLGIPWGAFQSLTTSYAADVTPLRLRPILTTFVNMCWVIGQFISVGVLRGFLHREDQWAYRIPYALQWIWPPIIIFGMLFAPESPTWLVKKGRVDDARRSLKRLGNHSPDQLNNRLAMIVHTDEVEKHLAGLYSDTTYLDCFKGINLRRTEAACGTWMIQVLCGVWFGSNVVYFLQRGGMNEENSFNFGLGLSGLALLGTMSAWWLMTRFGRRTLMLVGQTVMLSILLLVGFMGIPGPREAINWASGAFLMIFFLTFQLTVGPVCYCLVTELPSTRLRIKTVALARCAYNIVAIGANFLNPPILNPLAWNLRGKGGFVWAGFGVIMLIWAFFRLPETKDLTMAEIDSLFGGRVSARNFTKTEKELFRTEAAITDSATTNRPTGASA